MVKDITDKLSEVANELKAKYPDTAKLQVSIRSIPCRRTCVTFRWQNAIYNCVHVPCSQESVEKGFRDASENTKELRSKLGTEQEVVSKKTEELLGNIWTLLGNGAKEITKAINDKTSAWIKTRTISIRNEFLLIRNFLSE